MRHTRLKASVRGSSATIVGIVVLALVVGACQRPAAGPRGGQPAISTRGPGARQQVDDIALNARRTFDLDHVDPALYAAALGNAPERIFEFVRDRIAYEAYPGVLRGPRGTLLALAGNGPDRATLLAELLRRGGHRVRFVQGTLPEPIARELVTTMWATPPKPSMPKGSANGFMDSVKRDYQIIAAQLKNAKTSSPRAGPSVEALVSETRAHAWVQWERNGQWVDLDPLFNDAVPGKAYAKADNAADALPDVLFHRVTVRVRVEEFSEGARKDRQVLSFTTPAVELSGRDLVLVHQPENWRGPVQDLSGALSSGIEDTGRIRPVLLATNKAIIVGEPFRVRDARGIGRVGTLLGGSRRKDVSRATAEFVDFEFVAPDGSRQVVIREIFDVVGKALRSGTQGPSEKEIRERLGRFAGHELELSAFDLFFTTGRLHVSHLSNLPTEPQPAGTRDVDIRTALRRISIMATAVIDGLAGRFGKADRALIVLYPDSPRVYIAEFRSDGKTRRVSLDLRSDHVRAVALGPVQDDVRLARMLRGVISGSIEHAVLEYLTAGARAKGILGATISTTAITGRAQRERVGNVLLPDQFARLGPEVSPDSIARIREQTGAGWVAVAPERPVEINGSRRFAWWLVDPASGETIPVTDEGLHQVATDREVTVVAKKDSAGETAYYVASREGSMLFVEGPYFSGQQCTTAVNSMLADGFVPVVNPPWLPLVWP